MLADAGYKGLEFTRNVTSESESESHLFHTYLD